MEKFSLLRTTNLNLQYHLVQMIARRWLAILLSLHLILFWTLLAIALTPHTVRAADPECSARLRTAAAVSFDDQKVGPDTLLYQSVYTVMNWAGDLIATCLDVRGDKTPCLCEDWSGLLEECSDPFTPGFPEIKWSADTIAWKIDTDLNKIPDDGWWRRRKIITYSDQAMDGVPFDYLSISDKQRKWLRHDPDLLAFIRGDRSLEGVRFRKRSSYYGDFRHSIPVSYSSILLAGANDGMLHVFDEQSGHEYFSYIPNLLYSKWHSETSITGRPMEKLALLGDKNYQENHQFYVDGQVAVEYLEDRATTLAVGSIGRGGLGIYALDLFGIREMDDIEAHAADIVMWEYPDPSRDGLQAIEGRFVRIDPAVDESSDTYSDTETPLSTDPYLGRVFGAPKIVKLPFPDEDGYRWCVVFGNGYHSLNQTPVLYILDAYDGSLIRRVLTTKEEEADQSASGSNCNPEFGCNGLSSPVLVDNNEDGIIDYGYGGDLVGNLWKFDFTLGEIYGGDGYVVAFHDSSDFDIDGRPAPRPLMSVKDKQGKSQPITTEPTVTRPCAGAGEGMMVLFGTGWLDPTADSGSDTQSIYGIWDWQNFWRLHPDYSIDPMTSYYGEISPVTESGARPLSNLSNVLTSAEAERIGLLEQSQQSFVGLNYFTALDTQVVAGHVSSGETKAIVDDPDDFAAYDQVVRTLSTHRINWFSPDMLTDGSSQTSHLGWFFDLPFADEQLASDPSVLDGVLYYSTSLWSESSCGIDGSNRMVMAHDSCSGGAAETIVFDLNGDEIMSSADTVALYNLDGSVDGRQEQAAGIISTNAIASPTLIAGQRQDFMYVANYISDNAGTIEEKLIESGSQAEVVKSMVRGRNLGMTFWRELF